MQTAVGIRIGPYDIAGALGAGGMGEVYRARDSRLGRDVAIKILPSSCADDADRLRRFEQEARTAGGLNHPNLLVLFDVGTHDGTPYLVSELLDGETLRSALARKPLGLRKALDYGVQIARGLAAAHDKGIVHRDLKPENLFVTVDGRVKILDFGLARVTKSPRPGVAGAENGTHSTEPGVLLGTLAYMSPEQVRAQPADHRADVFAFGACMFEMVAGRRAFVGDSAADTAAAILHQEPWEVSGTDRAMPAGLERIVRRCLEKSPAERFQSASDLAFALEALSGSTVAGAATTEGAVSQRGHHFWAWACAGAALVAFAMGGFVAPILHRAPYRIPAPVVRTLVSVESAEAFGGGEPERQWIGGFVTSLALSPDGRRLAFVGRRGETRQLYLREFDQDRATLLPGTDGAENPFFSPDGEWIGFWARHQLFKIARRGGPAVALCSLPDPVLGASWEPEDRIVFAQEIGGLWQVPSDGGEPRTLTTLGAGELSHRLPHVLPGGDAVLFTVKTVWGGWERDARIAVESLRTHQRRFLVESAADARYVASGHLVFVRLGSLMAVPFDAKRGEVTGGVVGLAEGVAQAAQLGDYADDSGAGQFDIAPSGTLAYVPGGPRPLALASLVRVGPRGTVTDLSVPARHYALVRLSPDGRQLATMVRDKNGSGIWVFDIARTTMMPFERGAFPTWSPDGRDLVFTGEDSNLFRRRADASAPAALLLENSNYPTASSWSPDGKTMAFVQFTPSSAGGSQTDVLLLDLTRERSASRPLLAGPSEERHPEFSPDGRWLAYVSNESGRREVYVQPFPGTGAKLQVSIGGGTDPAWARTGDELFYLAPLAGSRMRMMLVPFNVAPRLSVGRPRILFEFDGARVSMQCDPVRCYDVAPDGQGFLAIQVHEATPTPVVARIDLVQNWLDDLRSRARSGH